MFKTKFLVFITLFAVLLTNCVPQAVTPTPPPIKTEEPGIPVTGVAVVQSVEVQIQGSELVQVNAIARGQLPDGGCTTIASISQARDGDTFQITLHTTTDPLAVCTLAATPFEQVIPLEVSNLLPAEYVVNVNGVHTSFELLPRDVVKFKHLLAEALNRRDYNLLKIMMNDTFMIGHWQSEGTSNTPDAAVEQLQQNLLNSASPITADDNKNLVELLGMDPTKIFDPQIADVNPLFVSGLGAQSRDEAILFTAKSSDGSLYWYGLLFAKDGFVKPVPIVMPVDTNVYPTSVRYVMAQVDVRVRSGPGMQFSVIGFIAAGQTAKVTGVSADGYWWRVICPDNTTGSCWVSAARHLTRPTDGVVTNPPPDPGALADVQSLEIQILESYPLQVNAIARGQLPDAGCTTISSVSQARTGNTFNITLKTKTDPLARCAQMLTPFDYVIPLDVSSLPAGTYLVNVHSVQSSFDLPESVLSTDVQYVMAQQDVSIYSGPGFQNTVLGFVAGGQIAKVTGVSANGGWWRVICPDNSTGSCWVSADPGYTQIANSPE